MSTLIAWYNSQGCIGRCDAKCYEAQHPNCACICGGMNHGAGLRQARENTQEKAEEWIEHWNVAHPETQRIEVSETARQLSLL